MAKRINFTLAPWQHWSKIKPDHIAIYSENLVLTWAELESEVNKRAGSFCDKNRPIAFLSQPENHFQTLLSLLAAWQQAVPTLLINAELDASTRHKILQETAIHRLTPLFGECKSTGTNAAPFDFEKPLTLTLTSGSTGTPKAIVHNANQHLYSAEGLFQLMPFEEKDTWLLSLPLYHISGTAIIWRWLSVGARLKIADYSGDRLAQAVKDVTHASLVPMQLERLMHQAHPSRLNSVLLGGMSLPHSLIKKAQMQGIKCWCGYGMTEMASTICAKRADDIDSVGSMLAFRDLILSEKNEILVKGQTLALGYFQQGKLVPIKAEWLATKDIGEWLENDELKIIGRMDNMFISGGENIQPEEIEKILSQFPNIGQVMVLPFACTKWGQVPVALVEHKIETDKLLSFCQNKLTGYQVPKKVFFIPKEMLKKGIKLSRTELAHWLEKMPIDEK